MLHGQVAFFLLHAVVEQKLTACQTLVCVPWGVLLLQILMFPSKSDGMFVPESLIFRSDSNGEDLEGYAGAGLYDSITMATTELKKVDYNGDRYDFCIHCLPQVLLDFGLSNRCEPWQHRRYKRMLQGATDLVKEIVHLHVYVSHCRYI